MEAIAYNLDPIGQLAEMGWFTTTVKTILIR
jgi:hypothetical protein